MADSNEFHRTKPDKGPTPRHELSRRTLMVLAGCVTCSGMGLGTAHALAGEPEAKPTREFDAGLLTEFASDGVYEQFARRERLLVIRKQGRIFVSSSTCTHRNCVVKFSNENNELRCPCHGSSFDDTGTILEGPATISLPRYGVWVRNQRLIVNTNQLFTERNWDKAGAFVEV